LRDDLGDHWSAHDGIARRPVGRATVSLDGAILGRIDEIVPPGIEVAPLEGAAYVPPAISELALRRRPAEKRAAA